LSLSVSISGVSGTDAPPKRAYRIALLSVAHASEIDRLFLSRNAATVPARSVSSEHTTARKRKGKS
jgi:hypothetical protein